VLDVQSLIVHSRFDAGKQRRRKAREGERREARKRRDARVSFPRTKSMDEPTSNAEELT